MVKKRKKTIIESSDTRKDKIFVGFVYIILFFVLIVTIYPLLYVVSASLSDPDYILSGQITIFPRGINLEGYRMIFANSDIWRGYLNTIYYTLLGTSINLIVTIPAAYALSRPEFYGKKFFTIFFIITMFISGGLIPFFMLIQSLGMHNTVWALVLPGATGVFNIVVTRTFFQSNIPREMEEAAIVDGCSDFYMFFKIILPLSIPIVAVMALFFGVGHWNSWFNALLFLDDRSRYPLQMILREILILQDMFSMPDIMEVMTDELAEFIRSREQLSLIMRYGVMIVATLPIIIVYPFLQKYFMQGVMVGSIKG